MRVNVTVEIYDEDLQRFAEMLGKPVWSLKEVAKSVAEKIVEYYQERDDWPTNLYNEIDRMADWQDIIGWGDDPYPDDPYPADFKPWYEREP